MDTVVRRTQMLSARLGNKAIVWTVIGGASVIAGTVLYLKYFPRSPPPSDETQPDGKPLSQEEVVRQLKEKGNKYFTDARFELAIKAYTEGIDLCASYPDELDKVAVSVLHQNRAVALHKLDKLTDAIDDVNSALKLNPSYTKALERRARLLWDKSNQLEGSEKCSILRQALKDMSVVCNRIGHQTQTQMQLLNSIITTYAKELAESRKFGGIIRSSSTIETYFQNYVRDPIKTAVRDVLSSSDLDSQNISVAFVEALKRVRSGAKHADIVDLCTTALNDESVELDSLTEMRLLLLRAVFHCLSGNRSSSRQDLDCVIDKCSKAHPRLSDVHLELYVNALIRLAQYHLEEAIADKALNIGPSSSDHSGSQTCLHLLQSAFDLMSDNPDVHYHRGQVHLLHENLTSAIADFDMAVKLEPKFCHAHGRRLLTKYKMITSSPLANMQQLDSLCEEFESVINIDVTCVENFIMCAQVLIDLQRWQEADEYLERAHKISPHNADILVHRGMVTLQFRGDIEGGISLLQQAIVVDEHCELAYQTWATVEMQRHNLAKAVELYDKAIALVNSRAELTNLIGMRESAAIQMEVEEEELSSQNS